MRCFQRGYRRGRVRGSNWIRRGTGGHCGDVRHPARRRHGIRYSLSSGSGYTRLVFFSYLDKIQAHLQVLITQLRSRCSVNQFCNTALVSQQVVMSLNQYLRCGTDCQLNVNRITSLHICRNNLKYLCHCVMSNGYNYNLRSHLLPVSEVVNRVVIITESSCTKSIKTYSLGFFFSQSCGRF